MSEEQLTTLFGDLTVVQAIMWLLAAAAFIAVLIWLWPKLVAAVRTLDMIAGLGERLVTIEDTVERVRAQVENSHNTNLRDEIDADRQAAAKRHDEVLDEMRGLKKDIGRLDRRDIEDGVELRETRDALDRRISNLETTLNTKDQ